MELLISEYFSHEVLVLNWQIKHQFWSVFLEISQFVQTKYRLHGSAHVRSKTYSAARLRSLQATENLHPSHLLTCKSCWNHSLVRNG